MPGARFGRRPPSLVGFGPSPIFGLPGPDRGNPLRQRDFQLGRGFGRVVEVGHGDPWQPLPDRPLDALEIAFFLRGNEREGVAGGFAASFALALGRAMDTAR